MILFHKQTFIQVYSHTFLIKQINTQILKFLEILLILFILDIISYYQQWSINLNIQNKQQQYQQQEQLLMNHMNHTNTISMNPFQLLAKLDNLNGIQPKSNKIYKQLQNDIAGYQTSVKGSLSHFQNKLNLVKDQFKELVIYQKEEEATAIIRLDAFQSSIKNILNQYTEQSKTAHQMINKLVIKFKEQFQKAILNKNEQNNLLLDQYSSLNERLQSVISSIKKKQSQMIKKYESLYKQVQQKMSIIIERINVSSQEILLKQDKFLNQITQVQVKIQTQLRKIDTEKQSKRFILQEAINRLIEDVTIHEDEQI